MALVTVMPGIINFIAPMRAGPVKNRDPPETQYTLSPNPSDGNITLKQSVADNKPVIAEVWNATGISVYKGQLHFEGGSTKLRVINAPPGMYLLQLIDSGGKRYTLKFVINDR